MNSSTHPAAPDTSGASWLEVGEPLASMQQGRLPLRGKGRFGIRWGKTVCARLVARLLGLPPPAHRVEASLSIVPRAGVAQWQRTFGGVTLSTTQATCALGMRERFGPLELCFELRALPGRVRFVQRTAALHVGWLRVQLPAWLAPRVRGRAKNCDHDVVRAEVEVRMPFVGLVIAYEGDMRIEEPR